jgi:hypothetical protein
MPPLKKSNLSNLMQESMTLSDINLLDRLQELEMQNSHLQALVVELLDKNERLRLQLRQTAAAS